MRTNYRCLLCMLLLLVALDVAAQNNTNSPYTRYGYGRMSDMGPANSRAMGGLAYGLRDRNFTNYANPASYTAIDSLTFIFEGGLSLQNANIDNGTVKQNAKNSSFDYLTMHFRFDRKLAASLGLIPISNVGYGLSNVDVDAANDERTTVTSYTGSGGLHQAYVGLAYAVLPNLSVGMNLSYLWGRIEHQLAQSFPYNSSSLPFSRVDILSVKSYNVDFGVQYSHRFAKKHFATFGAVFTPGHSLKNEALVQEVLGNSTMGYTENTQNLNVRNDMPNTIGVGLAYVYNGRLTLGLDGTYQDWSKVTFMGKKDQFEDMTRVSFGGEYIPNPMSRSFLARTKYRFGAYYSNPYYKIEGKRAAEEYGASVGLGIPLVRGKSYLNVSGQYVKVTGKTANFLDEKMLRVNVGITFNERWFYKYKVN